ncbi:hypothetical protein [Streptomyces sp. A30]|uniref:hypothetical protein n=1 Tax=Streptomyces sp. A30 TaxID=2789273 RepID=UPI00397F62B0
MSGKHDPSAAAQGRGGPTNGTLSGSTFSRAAEAPEEAVLPRPVVETSGLQPEDMGALAFLLLLGPDVQQTGKDLAAGMRALGWKMSDDRFEVIAKRLTAAGHLLRESVFDPETKRPKWHYSVYRNPANNPRYVAEGTATLSQVSSETRDFRVPADERLFETRENRVSPGQSRNPGFPGSGGKPGNPGFPSDAVSAGQDRNPGIPGSESPPPHPPEEEDYSSSPYPLTRPTGSLPSQREEEAGDFSKEETAAAERFLQQMERWQAGAATARKSAPRLLRAMRAQGWPVLTGLDDEHLALLEAEILKNTRGAVSWAKCLPGWVDDLRLYDRARSRPDSAGGGERCPDHPARYRDGCVDCAMAVPD